ncbi:ankyrin repeat, PH and SEC7 domain containing protein secG-like [Saccostrea echinata]|uniref:ankyrin repeat, PH and SEC7 domain containing protein secG-like n=1 Tax=Saccostrea echinata TaxID=191078 RepID=UPI002A81BB3C|nr:ankyrin repeat, PH and SEC7 domain containing protein secG-like [Saccostrea echinata]
MENDDDTKDFKENLAKFMKHKLNEIPQSPTIHQLVRSRNEEQLLEYIRDGCDINLQNHDGITALYVAVDIGNERAVELLLQNGAIVNTQKNPMHVIKDMAIAQLLLQAKGDVHARDEYGNTPLHRVIKSNSRETESLVDLYLSHGADIHSRNASGQTTLHTLCSSFVQEPESSTLTQKLIEKGASVNSKDSWKRSSLHVAVIHQYSYKYETINILKNNGASLSDLDLQGFNPIHHFIEQSGGCSYDEEYISLKYIDSFLVDEHTANLTTAMGQTILHLAIQEVPLEILKYLMKKGCKIHVKDNQNRCLLHYLVERVECTDILDYLVGMELDVNNRDFLGQTALHLAVEEGNTELTKGLVELGADLNANDLTEKQPIHVAAEKGWDHIIDFLIKEGANINALDKYQSTPLHFAAWNNQSSIALALIKAGCGVDLRDFCGQTAYDVAVFRSSFDFVQFYQKHYCLQNKTQICKFSKHANLYMTLETFKDIIESKEIQKDTENLKEFLNNLIKNSPTGIVYDDPEAIEIRDAIGHFTKYIAKCLSESDPKWKCTVYYAGSSYEGTKTLYPDEFDFIFCFDELSENIYSRYEEDDIRERVTLIVQGGAEIEETRPSVSDYAQIFLAKHTYYSYSELSEKESKIITTDVMVKVFTHLVSNIVYDENFPKNDRLFIKDVTMDPKVVFQWRGSKYKSLEINVDFVPAVRLQSWSNKLRITSKLLNADFLSLPCLAVPKMTTEEDENLWRCSLSLVETAIMKRCHPHIRNSYIAAKSLITSAVCPVVSFGDNKTAKDYYLKLHPDYISSEDEFEVYDIMQNIFPSYILKMAFFKAIEEKAIRDGVETVFNKCSTERDMLEQLVLREDTSSEPITLTCKECDHTVVQDVFKKCDEWLSNQFVPSFFNPRHNVMGSKILKENGFKVQYYMKYILKILNES